MGAVRRRPLLSVVLLCALLAGCDHHSSSRSAPPTSRTGGSSATTATSPPPPSDLYSASFGSEQDGWALTEEPCPRPGAAAARCAVAWKTTDGGGLWSRLSALDVPATGAGGPDFVSAVRFADARHGWAYDRSLFATFNGGDRWQRVDLGNPVSDLTVAGSRAYAFVGTCGFGTGTCTEPPRLAEGTISTGRWRFVSPGVNLADTAGGRFVVNGSDVYAVVTGEDGGQVFLARTAGGEWERRTLPCPRPIAAPIVGGNGLVAACLPAVPGDAAELQTSSDGGRSWAVVWHYAFAAPLASLAVGGSSAVVALDSGEVLRTTDNGMHFTPVLHTGANPALQFTDADHGVLTAGPAGGRQLFATADGGATWRPLALPH
jgi:hypothetical protein